MSALQTWMHAEGTSGTVVPLRSLPTADLGHLRQSLSPVAHSRAPEPLRTDPDDVELIDSDSHAWGGPSYQELEAYVGDLEGNYFDVAAAFEAADDDLRRPVDLLGLLEIAHRNGMEEQQTVSVVRTRRPDGSWRRFAFATVTARTTKENE